MALIDVQRWSFRVTKVFPRGKLTVNGVGIEASEIDIKFGPGSPVAEMAKQLFRPASVEFTVKMDVKDTEALRKALDQLGGLELDPTKGGDDDPANRCQCGHLRLSHTEGHGHCHSCGEAVCEGFRAGEWP